MLLLLCLLTPLGCFGAQCWRQPDFEGPIRLVFLTVFGLVVKTRNVMYFQTIVPLNLVSANNEKQWTKRRSNPLGVSLFFTVSRVGIVKEDPIVFSFL